MRQLLAPARAGQSPGLGGHAAGSTIGSFAGRVCRPLPSRAVPSADHTLPFPHPQLRRTTSQLRHQLESTCWVESRSCGRGAEAWPHLELGGHSDEGSGGTTESTGPTSSSSPKLPGHHGSLSCPARGMVTGVRPVSLRARTMDQTFMRPSDQGRDPCYGHSHDNFLPT